jgi:hypothetical protein
MAEGANLTSNCISPFLKNAPTKLALQAFPA